MGANYGAGVILILRALLLTVISQKWRSAALETSEVFSYLSGPDLSRAARGIVTTTCQKYGSIETLGTSTEGEEVIAVRLRKEGSQGLPKVKLVGNLHGGY
jgi:hypothetical protein